MKLGLPGLGVILTTETGYVEGARFHSRYFNPGKVLLEETATGSAHCSLGVIYAPRFDAIGKPMTATQGPRRRQGRITVIWDGKSGKEGGRMKLRGRTVTGQDQSFQTHEVALLLIVSLVARGGLFV
jgi:predicted PhzF superfamily epimerase YddE/YHI9